MDCESCGEYVVLAGIGQAPRFCSTRCRVRAHRAKKRLPIDLTAGVQWTRRVGKRPVQINGRPASSTDSATWATYAEARSSTAGDGLGVMLGDGLACFDLDHCFDGDTLTVKAADLLASIDSPLWVKRSMSGEGLHIFVDAPEAKGWKRDGIEFYSRARFIAVTGVHFTT